jgi:hypothetical protein
MGFSKSNWMKDLTKRHILWKKFCLYHCMLFANTMDRQGMCGTKQNIGCVMKFYTIRED